MAKINLDPQSEQSILNMLLDHSVLNDSAVSKIVNTSKEIGKTKIETAIELKLTDEQKILKLLSSSYSLDIVDLNEKKIDEKISIFEREIYSIGRDIALQSKGDNFMLEKFLNTDD